jgi:hypothetical protein
MRMSIATMRAIPLVVLGVGCFALAALVDVPEARRDASVTRIDIPALHAGAAVLAGDPSICADSIDPACVIDVPARSLAGLPQ